MIQVTLTFKSIEAARQALLDIPTSALVGGPAPEEAPAPKPVKAAKPAPAPVVAQPPVIAEPVEAPAPAAAPVTPEPGIDYPTLQKAVFALAAKSRDAAAAVAAHFGVKTFKELPADKWASALEAVQERIAILEA
jgi:hypothetical protein